MVLLVGTSHLNAQNDQLLSSVGTQLERLVDNYVKESFIASRFSQDVSDLPMLFRPSEIDSMSVLIKQTERHAEINMIRRDPGLHAQGSYMNNFAGSLLEDDGTFYQWRTNAGLGWNLIRDGVIAKRHKVRQKQLLWEAEKTIEDERLRNEAYRDLYAGILYAFNHKKVLVIRNRLDILIQLHEIVHKLFYLRFVQWEDVLDVMSSKTETELFLNNYLTYLDAVELDEDLKQSDVFELPVFDLVFENIEAQGLDTMAQFLSMQKRVEALDHQHHWSQEVSLRANLQYSYYQGGSSSVYDQRDFLSGGLSVGLPLSFQKKAKRGWKQAKVDLIKAEYKSYYDGVNNEVLNEYYEYQYALKQYVSFYYKKERLGVLIRRGIRKRNLEDPDYSPKFVVDKLDELFSVELELLDIQQKMYLNALKIFQLIDVIDVLPYIDIVDYNQFNNQFVGDRTIICTAEDLNELEVRYLFELLKYHGIKEVMVQIDSDLDLYLKYAGLLDMVQGTDMSVRLSFSFSKNLEKELGELVTILSMSLTPLIHFDFMQIKPDDLPQVVSQVENMLIADARALDLSVSLPGDMTVEQLALMDGNYSAINMDAGPIDNLHTLKRNIELLRSRGVANVRPVLVPAEYSSRLEMDQYINEIMDVLEVKQVCISSVGALLKLEAETISWHEERRF